MYFVDTSNFYIYYMALPYPFKGHMHLSVSGVRKKPYAPATNVYSLAC